MSVVRGFVRPLLVGLVAVLVWRSGVHANQAFVPARRALALVQPNPNIARAGMLHGDTLSVALVAEESEWRSDGETHPSMRIEAFAEPGKAPLIPGPLVRVAKGTVVRFSVRNTLTAPLTFFVPIAVRGGPDRMDAMDSVVIAPTSVGEVATKGDVPGNYIYRAITTTPITRQRGVAGLLTGALVVDSAFAGTRPTDRVFVLLETPDSTFAANFDPRRPPALDTMGRLLYTINGRSWPNTERVHATVGDSIHWRVINASYAPHPMHLHGFYYRVESFTGPLVGAEGRGLPGRHVVTELMWPYSSMSMTWSPDRPGNWLLHCHWAVHLEPDSMSAAPDDPHHREMVGLVLGVEVGERPGRTRVVAQQAGKPLTSATRRLRLVAVEDSASGDGRSAEGVPSMRFVIDENGRRTAAPLGQSPELDLVRGQPVAITIVNHLDEPTSVHWHGVEVQDSYVDGAPGFSGSGRHLAPAILPGDSFVVRFTPPRSGTFMYHTHMDDARQERAGMVGPLIVRDRGVPRSRDEYTFLLKGSRHGHAQPLEIDDGAGADTLALRVGRPARLRLASLAWINATPLVTLSTGPAGGGTRGDAELVEWTPVAKDGFDLPAVAQTPRDARQVISMGETYDYVFTPTRPGLYVLSVRPNPQQGLQASRRVLAQVVLRAE